MKQLLSYIQTFVHAINYSSLRKQHKQYIQKQTTGHYIRKDIPYKSQFTHREINQNIIEAGPEHTQNPKWQDSGAENLQEYIDWSWSGCGLACLQMILIHAYQKQLNLVSLAKEAESYQVYKKDHHTHGPESIKGLYHKAFITYLKKHWKFNAKRLYHTNTQSLGYYFLKDHYVIASVSAHIRETNKTTTKRSGHLILITGLDIENGNIQNIYYHNPSGFMSNNTQEHVKISNKHFQKYWSGNIMVIENCKPK